MKLTTTSVKPIEEVPYGVYVWRCSDGEFLGDGDGNVMNIFAMKSDVTAIRKIAEAAKHYGFPEGEAVFWSGRRPISDEEYAQQRAREKLGLVPDPLDYGAIADEQRTKRANS